MTSIPRATAGQPPLEVALEAARRAGRVIMRRFPGPKQVSHKARTSLVTDVDLQAEKAALDFLKECYPGFAILSEEAGETLGSSEYTWVVDPLDGTRNYAWGIPFFSTVVALTRGEEVLLGVVYDPVRREAFWGERGKGAFCNGKPIGVSRRASLEEAVLGTDTGYHDVRAKLALEVASGLWPGISAVRLMGSAALGLTYVACGRLDLYFHHSLEPWDVAGGFLLIEEAGGKITRRDGGPATFRSRGVIAANPDLHAQFLERIQGHPWQTA